MDRRRFLIAASAALAGALAVDGFVIEPGNVEFTYHEMGRGTRRVRFAQLSDLHLSGIGSLHEEIAERLKGEKLDFIIITGDAVDDNGALGDLDHFMRLLPPVPKYAIPGNWEHWGHVPFARLRDLYERHDCAFLLNRSLIWRSGDRSILITGLDDFIGGVPSIEEALRGVEPANNHLLLAHCPIYRDYIADYSRLTRGDSSRFTPAIDLDAYGISHVFSGHTHGGQVNLLGIRPFIPPGSGDYVQGWYRERGPTLYVSRGIGTSILPVRIGARPEVPIFTWHV